VIFLSTFQRNATTRHAFNINALAQLALRVFNAMQHQRVMQLMSTFYGSIGLLLKPKVWYSCVINRLEIGFHLINALLRVIGLFC
jgi:hypothetical protein